MGKDIKMFVELERSKFSSARNLREIYLSIYDKIDVHVYINSNEIYIYIYMEKKRETEEGKLILFVFALTTDSTLIY